MAESDQQKTPSLAEQWSLPENVQQPAPTVVPVEKATEEKPAEVTSADVAEEVTNEVPVAEDTTAEETNKTTAEETNKTTAEETNGTAAEESNETEQEVTEQEEAEEKPEIKIETAPADFRFPTTNQTRHCFTRYIEYHRCIAAKGEGAPDCDKFAKYYRALCPGEWVDRWNEQRENGTFPGPL
ncbi:cytochrome c oxidase subunit 6b-1-like [Iris pallida]|uniref:Cytochrome c oxidase subunit 6b-1-like n=1 Tax=Iris pallida TaxID=29817 RepID=A0AAX6GYA1_IRIPA|nr:cytochrome c oxidase subunit 6b-1-like [Iris pallida]